MQADSIYVLSSKIRYQCSEYLKGIFDLCCTSNNTQIETDMQKFHLNSLHSTLKQFFRRQLAGVITHEPLPTGDAIWNHHQNGYKTHVSALDR